MTSLIFRSAMYSIHTLLLKVILFKDVCEIFTGKKLKIGKKKLQIRKTTKKIHVVAPITLDNRK